MSRPSGVAVVVPVNVAEFHAVRWEMVDVLDPNIHWLAERFGWRISGVNAKGHLVLYGRNQKKYEARQGDWVIALGTNGSIRVVSDKTYRQDYREVSE